MGHLVTGPIGALCCNASTRNGRGLEKEMDSLSSSAPRLYIFIGCPLARPRQIASSYFSYILTGNDDLDCRKRRGSRQSAFLFPFPRAFRLKSRARDLK